MIIPLKTMVFGGIFLFKSEEKDLKFHEKCLDVFEKCLDVFRKCLDVLEKRLEVLEKGFIRKILFYNDLF